MKHEARRVGVDTPFCWSQVRQTLPITVFDGCYDSAGALPSIKSSMAAEEMDQRLRVFVAHGED